MAKFRKFCFHHFSGSKLPTKMLLAISTRCLLPEICILCHFGLKMGLKRPKNGKISEILFSSFFWLETTSNKRGHKVPGNTKDQIRKIKNKKQNIFFIYLSIFFHFENKLFFFWNFRNLGQKRAQKWAKTAQKMVKI